MRTFDFSLFGDNFSVVIPVRAPRWQTAARPGGGAVFWATAAARRRQNATSATRANVMYDDEGEVSYRDEDYAVFETLKAYDYQD